MDPGNCCQPQSDLSEMISARSAKQDLITLYNLNIGIGGAKAKSLADTLVEWALIVLVTILFTWFYNRTKGSLLVTALLHAAMNTTGSLLNVSLGALVLLLVFTLFVILFDRMWKKLPSDNPQFIRKASRRLFEGLRSEAQ